MDQQPLLPDLPENFQKLSFKLPRELRHAIFRDWGIYHQNHKRFHRALKAFQASFDTDPDDFVPLEKSSKCNYEICKIEQAIQDILAAIELNQTKPATQIKLYHHLIDCMVEQNKFEQSLIQSHQLLWKNNQHTNITKCNANIDYLESIISGAIGEVSGSCLLNARIAIRQVERRNAIPPRARRNICETLIVPVAVKKHPMHVRRDLINSRLLNSIYLGSSGKDFSFLTELSKSSTVHLKQTPESTRNIKTQINDAVKSLSRWRSMLQNREPLYTKIRTSKENREIFLYRVQRQTRREVFKQVEEVRSLMLKGDKNAIVKRVQNLLRYYYSIKTKRVFPRKFEFSNDLCNMVGLTYLNSLKVPGDLLSSPQFDRIMRLFNLRTFSAMDDERLNCTTGKKLKLGDFSAVIAAANPDKTFSITKSKLESWMALNELLQYPVEYCFVHYEMAKLDMAMQKVDEALILARTVVVSALACKNNIWLYLGYFMMARCDQMRRAYPNVQFALIKMRNIAEGFHDNVKHYTSVAFYLNDLDIEIRTAEERNKEQKKQHEELIKKLKREWLLKQSVMLPAAVMKAKFGDVSERATRASEIARDLAEHLVSTQ